MKSGLELLRTQEDESTLLYACPLPPSRMEPVKFANGTVGPGIKPAMPRSYNFATGEFVDHDVQPVICAGVGADFVAFHGLVRAAAQLLPPYARRNGWDVPEEGPLRVRTTQAMVDFVTNAGDDLEAFVYRLERATPPFESMDRFEWRSPQAVPWIGKPQRITGVDWPEHIVDIVEPYAYVQYDEAE